LREPFQITARQRSAPSSLRDAFARYSLLKREDEMETAPSERATLDCLYTLIYLAFSQ